MSTGLLVGGEIWMEKKLVSIVNPFEIKNESLFYNYFGYECQLFGVKSETLSWTQEKDACFYVIAAACLPDLHGLWISSGIR